MTTRKAPIADSRLFVLLMLGCLLIFSSCAQPASLSRQDEGNLTIEQYFYSKNEAALRKLSDKLKTEGYSVNDFKSYELDGKTEWYFYSAKEITQSQIAGEDSKSEQYAAEFGVDYDGHGSPLE